MFDVSTCKSEETYQSYRERELRSPTYLCIGANGDDSGNRRDTLVADVDEEETVSRICETHEHFQKKNYKILFHFL